MNPMLPHGNCLDLGWCVLRPLSDQLALKVHKVKTYSQDEARMAAYARLSRSRFKALPDDRKRELRLGCLWMTRQFDPPRVGTPFYEETEASGL
ncbi:hypothetical protein D3218_19145 [Aureimonas flava]|uniref:Uncharacterized protein n=1 Tax=Aureimonas flava TaxID=2320271 RepID=A0A3A1WHW4_9HYPH|nr:hypothetical protein [Aureimonas flava]RIX97178.1 hypothetical protein D3218_19145 [Aureimonas flava]